MYHPIDLMIIGAQKSGTTSLKNYLMEHPEVCGHIHKEFVYFEDDEEFNMGYSRARKKYFGSESERTKKRIAKHATLYTNEEALKRLKEHNPEVIPVLLLRNPVERTYSSFLMEYNYGAVRQPFSDIEKIIKGHQQGGNGWMYDVFVGLSLYSDHIDKVFQHFPKERIQIILFDDFTKDPVSICRDLFECLGVSTAFSPDISKKHNPTKKISSRTYARALEKMLDNKNPVKRALKKIIPADTGYHIGEFLRSVNRAKTQHAKMDESVRQYLIKFFKPYNERLGKMIGKDLSAWDR